MNDLPYQMPRAETRAIRPREVSEGEGAAYDVAAGDAEGGERGGEAEASAVRLGAGEDDIVDRLLEQGTRAKSAALPWSAAASSSAGRMHSRRENALRDAWSIGGGTEQAQW